MRPLLPPQMLSFDLFMLIVRPLLIVLVMMLSGIYIDAFSGEVADVREGYPSVAGDLIGIVHDGLNRRDQQVWEAAHCESCAVSPACCELAAAAAWSFLERR